MLGLRTSLLATTALLRRRTADQSSGGLFHIVTGSYDIPAAHIVADGYYTNKAPGGVAYRCSFRVTEASYLIERLVDKAASEIKMDPAEFRMKNFIPADAFPYQSATGWLYDSGNYQGAMNLAALKSSSAPTFAGAGGEAKPRAS